MHFGLLYATRSNLLFKSKVKFNNSLVKTYDAHLHTILEIQQQKQKIIV